MQEKTSKRSIKCMINSNIQDNMSKRSIKSSSITITKYDVTNMNVERFYPTCACFISLHSCKNKAFKHASKTLRNGVEEAMWKKNPVPVAQCLLHLLIKTKAIGFNALIKTMGFDVCYARIRELDFGCDSILQFWAWFAVGNFVWFGFIKIEAMWVCTGRKEFSKHCQI